MNRAKEATGSKGTGAVTRRDFVKAVGAVALAVSTAPLLATTKNAAGKQPAADRTGNPFVPRAWIGMIGEVQP